MGLILVLYIILSKFKRIAVTKSLVSFNLVIVIMITMIFFTLCIITLYSLLSKKETKQGFYYLKNLKENHYYTPLKILDKFINDFLIKTFKFERLTHINKFLHNLYIKILKPIHFQLMNKYFITYFSIKFIPKLITTSVFLLDIFYFHQFYYFYWSLPLLLLPLMLQYIKHVYFEDYFNFVDLLETNLEIADIKTGTKNDLIPMLNVSQYLNQIIIYHLENKPNPFIGRIGLSYSYFKNRTPEQRTKNINYDKIREKYIWCLNWIEKVHVIHHLLITTEKRYNTHINLIIFSCYFIGWLYILLNLPFDPFEGYTLLPNENNPFL